MSLYKLKELGSFKNGANYPKGSYGKGLPIINVKDLFTTRYVDLSDLVELLEGTLRNEDDYTVENNDILFSRSSLVQSGAGMCAIVHGLKEKTLFCGFIIRFRINRTDIVNPLYLLYLLRTPVYRKLFTGTQQTNIANINQDTLGDIEVDLPDIDVQNEIVSVLNNIDTKVDLNNSICADFEAMIKQIYDYWFVQFDFPDENGKTYKSSGGKMVMNEELGREIPEGWEVKTIGDIVINHDSERIPVANKDRDAMAGNIPYYGATGIMGYVNRAIFHGDYVLLAEDGSVMDKNGHPIIQRVWGDVWVNNHAHVLEPTDGYSCKLLMMVLSEIPVVQIKSGSIQAKINQANLNRWKIPDIPESLKRAFDNIVIPIEKELINTIEENQELTSLRDYLLPLLMNGQVTFSDQEGA